MLAKLIVYTCTSPFVYMDGISIYLWRDYKWTGWYIQLYIRTKRKLFVLIDRTQSLDQLYYSFSTEYTICGVSRCVTVNLMLIIKKDTSICYKHHHISNIILSRYLYRWKTTIQTLHYILHVGETVTNIF